MSRKSDKERKRQPNVAVYLDDVEELKNILDDEYGYEDDPFETRKARKRRDQRKDDFDDEDDDYRRQDSKRSRKAQRKRAKQEAAEDERYYRKMQKKKKRRRKPRYFRTLLVVLLLLQVPMIYGIASAFKWKTFDSRSDVRGAKGFLLLGYDDSEDKLDAGHTDSVTYLAVNFRNKQAVTQPIYRDARIMQTCTGTEDNINRIYMKQGIRCLAESTSSFLGLPVDYYVLISMTGLIKIVDQLGSIELAPTDSFCSDFGNDGQNYCFSEGVVQDMTGAQTLAYARYRGSTNGESRANRQIEIMMGIKNKCMKNLLVCYVKVTPFLKGKVETNIPLTEVFDVLKIFSSSFEMDKQSVIAGHNVEIEDGWTQFIDEDDRRYKSEAIRNRIFIT